MKTLTCDMCKKQIDALDPYQAEIGICEAIVNDHSFTAVIMPRKSHPMMSHIKMESHYCYDCKRKITETFFGDKK